MYEKTATDTFRELVTGQLAETRGIPYRVTQLSDRDARLANGIEYCSVQVTFSSGIQYGIEAFGEEGIELRKAASSMKEMSEPAAP